MSPFVQISFDCMPLRSVSRWDIPLDASPAYQALCERIKQAAAKHGLHNSYYLCSGHCVFHLTNDPSVGMLSFSFEGTALTDTDDRLAVYLDLQVQLGPETCDWLAAPIVDWFRETVRQAVQVEFQRYLSATDSDRTCQRQRLIESVMIRHQGFVGLGL